MNISSTITPHEESPIGEERFVASGSTCACYLLQRHGRLLLKKQLLPSFADNERYRQALEKEFEVGFRLDHPHIPHYLEFHGDALLMDYVDGETLTDFIRCAPSYFRKRKQARQFAEELLSAVAYLHQHQVLHLDLKPDNIMLTRIGHHVKLVDLGYCYQDGYPFTTGGTAHYSALDKEKTPASDIYSLGRIFGELGIGRKAVIEKCVKADAAKRYQSVDELAAALRKRNVPSKYLLLPLMLLLLLGVGTWWRMGRNTPSVPASPAMSVEKDTADVFSPVIAATSEIASDGKESLIQMRDEMPLVDDVTPLDNNAYVTAFDSAAAPMQDAKPDNVGVSKPDNEQRGFNYNRQKALEMFKPVADSVLADLKQFVSDERMPYKMGSLKAYKAAYESLKTATLDKGRKDPNHFWARIHWSKYNGKPKPYDPIDDYLYQEITSIDALFRTRATNYNFSQ